MYEHTEISIFPLYMNGTNITTWSKIHQEPILQHEGRYTRKQYYNMKEDTPGNNITISRKIHQEPILQYQGKYIRNQYYNMKEDTPGNNITISRKIHQEWILQHEGRYTRKHYYNIKEDTLGINITIWMDTFVHLKLGRKLEKIFREIREIFHKFDLFQLSTDCT